MQSILKMLMQLLTGGGGQSQLASLLPGLLGASGGLGGLSGLLGMLDGAGAGDAGRSWVSNGKNMKLSPDVLKQVLGSDKLNQIAAQAGVSPNRAAAGLSKLLPEAVDKLTPNGELPADDELEGNLSQIPQLLGR